MTGFDNNPVRQHFSPLVTTISLSVYEMTFFAARWLRDRIISRDAGILRLEIDGQLIEGESV